MDDKVEERHCITLLGKSGILFLQVVNFVNAVVSSDTSNVGGAVYGWR